MEGKTLFLKWNTGPSGHGMPPAAGQAFALKRAGASEVKVFAVEGEGGLTPGASHETRNSAWGLGLDNLVFLLDWNDYGIDDNAVSSVVHGAPVDWFAPYGWRVLGTEQGSEWAEATRVVLEVTRGENTERVPTVGWFKTRKGRGYLVYDNKSHGTPHKMNSEQFWELRKQFMTKYGVAVRGRRWPAARERGRVRAQAEANLRAAMTVMREHRGVADYLSDRLVELAESVPDELPGFRLGGRRATIFQDPRLCDFRSYPESMWAKPGATQPNRAALATWGAWVNSFARKEYGRPLFIACSADLAESTNIVGFVAGLGRRRRLGLVRAQQEPRGRRSCRSRSPSSRTPGSRSGSRRSTWPRIRWPSSTGSGPRARPTARSRTSSTGRCACSASSRRTAT